MRLLWAAATVVCGQENGIHSPQLEDDSCTMNPFPFSEEVYQYGVECEAGTRAFNLQVLANTNVEVIGPTGRTRAAGDAGQLVEAKVVLFQSMLTSLSVDAFGGVYAVNIKVKRPEGKIASRAFVWKDEQENTHMVMARSLPEINLNGLPDTGVVQWTGQPYKNFELCSYESGVKMTSQDYSTSYWIHTACKTGSVDAASIILAGRDLEKKDIKCEVTPTCPKYKSNTTITALKTMLGDESKMKPYLLKLVVGDHNKWDMLGCALMQTVCTIGTETIEIEAAAYPADEVDRKIDASPIVPHCVKPGVKQINIAMQYDLGGLELPDQICNQRGTPDNNIFMCPADVDHVKVEVYVNDASALALAWGKQIPKVDSNREGEIYYTFEAPVGTMGCNNPEGCPRGPFSINVLCGDAFDEVKMAIANNKGVHGKPPLPVSPIGDIGSTDCKMEPEFHPKVHTYSIECKSEPEIPMKALPPPHVQSLILAYRYKSETLGAMEFQNDDEKFPDSIHLQPSEKTSLEVRVKSPPGKRYTFHLTRLGTKTLNFEPFQFKELQTKTEMGDICTVHPDWAPKKHFHYNISCSQGIKTVNMTIPPPEEIDNEVVEIIFESKVLFDVDYISSNPDKVEKYQLIPMKLGESIDIQINTEEPVEGPTYHFNVHRSGGALGADFTEKLANFFSALAPALAIMSGGNFITVIKFIQFMGIFAAMNGVPEAYGDFVDKFKSFNFQFDIMAFFPKEKIEGMIFSFLGPSMGLPSNGKGDAMADLKTIKKKYSKQYKEIKRKINDIKEKISADGTTLQQLFMVPGMVFLLGCYHGYWQIRYRCKPSLRPQHNIRELEFMPLTFSSWTSA
jgi:hypothetical protein